MSSTQKIARSDFVTNVALWRYFVDLVAGGFVDEIVDALTGTVSEEDAKVAAYNTMIDVVAVEHDVPRERVVNLVEMMGDSRWRPLFTELLFPIERATTDIEAEGPSMKFPDKSVYLAVSEATGLYKIGKSNDPQRRMGGINAAIPPGADVVRIVHLFETSNAGEAEDILHKLYDEYRVDGEWFELDSADVQDVCSITSYVDGSFYAGDEVCKWVGCDHERDGAQAKEKDL